MRKSTKPFQISKDEIYETNEALWVSVIILLGLRNKRKRNFNVKLLFGLSFLDWRNAQKYPVDLESNIIYWKT